MRISAVIFDLNGTVLDDEDIYNVAFNKVLKSLGVNTVKPLSHERGIGVKENWDIYLKTLQIKTTKSPEVLAKETQDEYLKLLGEVSVRPGFDEFAQGLKDSGIKIALATSNTWEVTMSVLEKVGLMDFFDSVTTAEEVKYLKPEPDLFIVAADKTGVERYDCLVIEDAPSGIIAAQTAGMKVIAISEDEEYEKQLHKADLVVEGFSEITAKVIAEL